MHIDELLRMSKERQAVDIILTVGCPPVLRIDKKLSFTQLPSLSKEEINDLLQPLLDNRMKEVFEKNQQLSFIYSLSGWGRFRISIFKQRDCLAAAIRRFPFEIPNLEELNLPVPTLTNFCNLRDGLVLITGPVGSGKTTTLASMLDLINKTKSMHIITLEDPVEYIFNHNKCVFEQRFIGYDCPNITLALKEIMHQNPDIVVIGEIHDAQTIRETLRIAEAGVLVFATFHTPTAKDTINRIINFFPGEEKEIQFQLSMVMRGVFSQQLIPRYQQSGLVPAWETLVVNERVVPIIREGTTQQIDTVIETSSKYGMCSMDQSLTNLYNKKLISKSDYIARLRSKEVYGNLEDASRKESTGDILLDEDKDNL